MAYRTMLRSLCSKEPWLMPISSTRYLNGQLAPGYWVNPGQQCRKLSCIPQEAVIKSISFSKKEARVGQTTDAVIGGTVADASANEWLALDQQVNSYPTDRGFTAIGTGGEDFVHTMIVAVESVLEQPIPEGQVKHKTSSGGKYISVNIGPIRVSSGEQVQAVYDAMKRDDRVKYFF